MCLLLTLYNQSKKYYPATYPDIPTGYVGLVGRLTYDYATRYLFDVNVGYNGSENFAPGKRYGLFPAVSVGWVMSEVHIPADTRSAFPVISVQSPVSIQCCWQS